ncbi:uncharacterized protein N7443_001811 [Penicillium atrosanguineum]|uniref:uncharacterized protein n=1 Tax=Penicillium atrosanguineum TaxID=1132637 RepID=UPI00238797D6|nr:uncharacterized protein N7443_001811 [Penicillium atrosanguineum]KAJ5117846.1 hypothetical protein N7526_010869 [Penicillium atrosanguineum]KAJ5309350.1 hypothetical protein N7443_001811 [Penicillium atrosanguineum]
MLEHLKITKRSGAPSYEGAKYFERNSPAVELSQRLLTSPRKFYEGEKKATVYKSVAHRFRMFHDARHVTRHFNTIHLNEEPLDSTPLVRIMCAVAGVVRIRRRNFRDKDEQAMIH